MINCAGLSKRESEISAELTQKRDELYAKLAELTQMKHIELSYMDRNAMEAAKACFTLMFSNNKVNISLQ